MILLMACAPLRSHAEPGIAELKNELGAARTDSQKYLIYQQLFKYYEFTKKDSAAFYLDQGYKAFTASGFMKGQAMCLTEMADIYAARGLFQPAKAKHEEALAIFTALKDPDGIADVHNGLGVIEGRSGQFDSAVGHFLTALRLFEQTKNVKGIVSCYLKLGTANDLAGNLDKALEYYKKALETAKSLPISGNIIVIYNNIGVVYCRRHQYKEAESYFQQSLELIKEPKYETLRIQPLGNLGNLYRETGDETKAQEYFEQSLDIARREHLPEEESRALLNIALLVERKATDRALTLLGEAQTVARSIGHTTLQAEIMDAMIEIYRHKGDYYHALILQDTVRALDDSLVTVDKAKQIANMQSIYDLEKSNGQIVDLRTTQAEKERNRNALIIALTLAILGHILLGIYVVRTMKLNRKLKRREAELQRANYVKDRLFSVVGHDLRGPIANIPVLLNFLKDSNIPEEERNYMMEAAQTNASTSAETLDTLLAWGKAQIRGVMINQTVFPIKEIIQNEVVMQRVTATGKHITITDNTTNTDLFADKDHFRIIIRNLLSNAVKFTEHGGAIILSAIRHSVPGYTLFSVKDNGVGMDAGKMDSVFGSDNTSTAGTANELGHGLGLLLCKTFVEENGGRIWVESEQGRGSVFYFTLRNMS
jgi:signal transduction histidine kinase/Flp pilus assembly protein TadD